MGRCRQLVSKGIEHWIDGDEVILRINHGGDMGGMEVEGLESEQLVIMDQKSQ